MTTDARKKDYFVRPLLPVVKTGIWMSSIEIRERWPFRVTKCVVE